MRARSRIALPVAFAVALACALLGGRARAFCRGVTAAPPAGYDPAIQGCFGAGLLELYWQNLCVGYSLARGASAQVTLDQATDVAASAFDAWSHAACSGGGSPSITAVSEGPVDCDVVGYEEDGPNQHVIVFRDDGWPYSDSSNTLGLTTITYDATTGEIFDADMELNSHDFVLVPSGPVPEGAYDLASVMTHEAGHFLGLAHSDVTSAVMYAHYQSGFASLDADDVAGICAIDPPGGARSTEAGMIVAAACDPTPRHGFSAECSGDGGAPAATDGAGADAAPVAARKSCSASSAPPGDGTRPLALAWASPLIALALRRRRRARAVLALAIAAPGLAACAGDDSNTTLASAATAADAALDATQDATGAAPPDAAIPPLPVALVRFANWSPDAPPADVCLAPHGTTLFRGPLLATLTATADGGVADDAGPPLSFPQVSAYVDVAAPGAYDVRVVAAGAYDCSVGVAPDLTTFPPLRVGAFATIALAGLVAPPPAEPGLTLLGFLDDEAPAGAISMRLINAAPPLPEADLGTGTMGSAYKALFVGVPFGGTAAPSDAGGAPIDSNGYAALGPLSTVTLSAHAPSATTDSVVASNVSAAAGSVLTIALLGGGSRTSPDASALPVQLLECVDNAGTTGVLGSCSVLAP
jgi:hypothetical protein